VQDLPVEEFKTIVYCAGVLDAVGATETVTVFVSGVMGNIALEKKLVGKKLRTTITGSVKSKKSMVKVIFLGFSLDVSNSF
jgi:hypothetical protein